MPSASRAGSAPARENPDTASCPPVVERSARHVIVYSPRAPGPVVRAMSGGTAGLIRNGRMLKRGDRSTVVLVDTPDGAPVVLKRFNRKGPLHTTSHSVVRSRAAWCWHNGHRLHAAGLRTPEPLACLEWRLGPLRLESCVLTSYTPGPTLLDHVRSGQADEACLRHLADEFARAWDVLGTLRAHHDDMKASNFIVGRDGRLWLVDLDGMRFDLPGPIFRRARRVDLARFMRNWRDQPEVAAIFRAPLGTA